MDSVTALEPPYHPKWSDVGYSNYSHEWDEAFEPTALVERGVVAPHTAWDHFGAIWWQDGQFHEQIWVHGAVLAVVSERSLQSLIRRVNDEWGEE